VSGFAALTAPLALAAAEPAQADCQSLFGTLYEQPEIEALPNVVDGAGIAGPKALLDLRRSRGPAVLVVRGGDFSRADLRGARLANTCFLGTRLGESDWRGADASGSAFVGADLTGANFAGALLPRVLFRNAVLKDVAGDGAVLAGGRLDGGWFEGNVEGLRLDRANLTGFRFECGGMLDDGCPVYQGGDMMSLRSANLTGANLYAFAEYEGARINRTQTGPDQLSSLRSAHIEGPILVTGGESDIVVTPTEFRELLAHLEDKPPGEEAAIEKTAGRPLQAAPGATLYFADHLDGFRDSLRAHRLYRKLLPALIGSASARVAVTVNRDGTIDAYGEAWGANGHSCSLAGERLRFDRATGWYVGATAASADDPPAWRGKPMPVLRFHGATAEVWQMGHSSYGAEEGDPRSSDFASCGVRAAFSPMIRAPLSTAEARRRLAAMKDGGGR